MTFALAPGFLDRNSEREVIDGVLAKVRGGQSAVLVIRGEAGIGKTALLQYAADQASDFRVERVTGVEAEMELPYAGIHQLCAPMLSASTRFLSPSKTVCASRWALPPGKLLTDCWSDWPYSACCPPWPRSGRWSVSWRTRNGSTPPPG